MAADIDRQKLDPDEARTHFESARVDARNVNFSDTIDGRKRSYRVSRGRRHNRNDDEIGESTEDEDDRPESLSKKLARLRREWEEVRMELDRRESDEGQNDVGELEDEDRKTLDELGEEIKSVQISDRPSQHGHPTSAVEMLEQQLRQPIQQTPKSTSSIQQHDQQVSENASLLPNQPTTNLSKITTFDTRLTHLETLLGISTLPLPVQSFPHPKPLLPTLTNLDRQITTLTTTSPTALDAMTNHIHTLLTTAEHLASAQPTTSPSSPTTTTTDPDQDAKINALYGTLPTIESLAPLLPSVLDRLRSLRLIHADAAGASQSLAAVEKRQAEMGKEIRSWREGLRKVVEVVEGGEERMKGNARVVEKWVKELEGRVRALGEG